MKKKIFICLLLCIILYTIAGCTNNVSSTLPIDDASTPSATQSETTTYVENDKMNNYCTLMVNGNDITAGNHVRLNYEHRYAELPLTVVVKELGAKVEWEDKTKAKITFGGKDYILDTTKGSLVESGSTFNVLMVAPGSNHSVFY